MKNINNTDNPSMGGSSAITGFLRKHLIMIVTVILAIAALIPSGIYVIAKKSAIEAKQSSFKLTTFEYVIASPTKEQVDGFSKNDAVNKIFPCYNFEITAKGNYRFPVLMSDSLENYEISLFNEDTCIEGKADASGIMLDETAAERLGVKVGDSVSFVMGGRQVSLKVSGIYMASTYTGLEKGLGLAVFTDEMKSYFNKEITYKLAFIDAKDEADYEELLGSYIPYGECMSEEEYISNRKDKENCPPDMTEEAWTNGIIADYIEYKSEFERGTYDYAVQIKANYMKDVEDQIETRDSDVTYISVIFAVAVFAAYTLLAIVYVYMNKKDDEIEFFNGTPHTKLITEYLSVIISGALLVTAIVGVTLFVYASAENHLSACILPILLSSLPALPAAIIAAIFAKLHIDKIYKVGTAS